MERVLNAGPTSANNYYLLAQIERARDRLPEAFDAVNRSLVLKYQYLDASLLQAELLLKLDRAKDAFLHLEKVAEHFGDESRLLNLRIRAAEAAGESEDYQKLTARLRHLTLNDASSR
jgi:hypothetical protein